MDDFTSWRGKAVLDRDGNKVGSLSDLYIDEKSGRPTWATVKTGLFGTKENFFPISISQVKEEEILVDTTEDQIKNSPKIDIDTVLEPAEERELYDYYKQDWDADEDDDHVSASETDDDDLDEERTSGVTGKRETSNHVMDVVTSADGHAPNQIRLKKYVVTDHVTVITPQKNSDDHIDSDSPGLRRS